MLSFLCFYVFWCLYACHLQYIIKSKVWVCTFCISFVLINGLLLFYHCNALYVCFPRAATERMMMMTKNKRWKALKWVTRIKTESKCLLLTVFNHNWLFIFFFSPAMMKLKYQINNSLTFKLYFNEQKCIKFFENFTS